ncbi:hypothetical protein [Ferruginibacter albus]|uniref:hypothetical protein n=1 Tax=Ferruginibacter albus TaxID=2875540 RepID=UPI001CC7EE4C|nr:hypothetical protein [Ferruginibacter albus]UAY53551.1 hypothetical protein K9M53_07760 [Ferruginibacter albus]
MKILLLAFAVFITASFNATTNSNVLIGKWELFYIGAAGGGWASDGNDTVSSENYTEKLIPHGRSQIIEFKNDSLYTTQDFSDNSSKTIYNGKYKLIDSNKICLGKVSDTMVYSVIKDTLIFQIQTPPGYNYSGKPLFITKFLRQK